MSTDEAQPVYVVLSPTRQVVAVFLTDDEAHVMVGFLGRPAGFVNERWLVAPERAETETTEAAPADDSRKAAVALIQREDGCVLCVWNLRYEGFSLPGGMVEVGERVDEALRRELREETSLEVVASVLLFAGSHGLRPKMGERGGRASEVWLYRVTASGEPREVEPGCRIEWLRWEEFLAQSPFGAFYRTILPVLQPNVWCAACGEETRQPPYCIECDMTGRAREHRASTVGPRAFDVDGRKLDVDDVVEIVDAASAQPVGLRATIVVLVADPPGYVDLEWNRHPSGGARRWIVPGRFVRRVP